MEKAIFNTLVNHAKECGNRIVADGKTIWAGLGNRSGLHSYIPIAIGNKWKQSGARFEKKLNTGEFNEIEIHEFRNITRDRGRWVCIQRFDLRPKATFNKVTDFCSWHDDNAGRYSETEIDGYLIGILENKTGDIIGIWYNQAGFGTISKDFAEKNPDNSQDEIAYCEQDIFWPYGD